MTFASFVEQYEADMKIRLKKNTGSTKAHIIRTKPVSYYTFEMLYWCGIREGEMLAKCSIR
jgi:hypothetical protein